VRPSTKGCTRGARSDGAALYAEAE